MICPRCKVSRDILDFQRFGEVEEFASETAPIYKCPKQQAKGGCGWIFAPAEQTILQSLMPDSISAERVANGKVTVE